MPLDKLNLNELLRRSQNAKDDFLRKMRELKVSGGSCRDGIDQGGVRVVLNGVYEVIKVEIDAALVTKDRLKELEKLVLTAVNEAVRKLSDPLVHADLPSQDNE